MPGGKEGEPIRNQASINIDLWFGNEWTDGDLRDLGLLFEQFGTVSGQRSYNLRGLGLEITIAFVAGAIAGGFFSALGEDLYLWMKKKIAEIVNRPAKRHPEGRHLDFPDTVAFIIKDTEAKVEIHLSGSYRSEEELYEYLACAPLAFDAIWDAIHTGRYPCIRSREHIVLAHWGCRPDAEWDMSILVRDSATDSSQWQVSVGAFVPGRELTKDRWGDIRWLESEEARKYRARRSSNVANEE